MDIRQLEYFVEVARQKSFSKAAEIVHISQPSMSKAIKDIENQLGVILFYRTTKYVELTDIGESIYEQAQQIVSSFHNINTQLEDVTTLQTGKISIGLPPITAVTTFSSLLGLFKKQYPNIIIHLYEFGSKRIEIGVQDETLDIGVMCVNWPDSEQFEMICCVQDHMMLIMNPEHSLACREIIDYPDLIDESFVLYSNDFSLHDQITARCKQAGFHPKVIFETSQRELMTQVVSANLGIALLPSMICKELDADKLIYRPMADPQLCLRLDMVWKKDRYLSHAAREWVRFVKNNLTPH
jgi:DNA-binding transcriptional LysR family regulator